MRFKNAKGEDVLITHNTRIALSIAFMLALAACGGGTTAPPPLGNTAPIARAGADQLVYDAATVTLNGNSSTDADGDPMTFSWTLTTRPTGSTATLAGADTARPTFAPDIAGSYVARLIVHDGQVNSAPSSVTVTRTSNPPPWGNATPIAHAGTNQTVTIGTTVTLDGTQSSDGDDDPLTFAWAFTNRPAGSTATLTGATTATPSFTTDRPGRYVIRLMVDDGKMTSQPSSVVITADPVEPIIHYYLYGSYDYTTYLGCLNCDKVEPDSVCNEAGVYGSSSTAQSIWTKDGTYGSIYSGFSPWSQYSTSGPIVIGSDELFYGHFTINTYQANRTTVPAFVDVLDYFSGTGNHAATQAFACGN